MKTSKRIISAAISAALCATLMTGITANAATNKRNIQEGAAKLAYSTYIYNAAWNPRPAVTLTWRGQKLVQNTDYTVAYSSNLGAGQAKVKITGKGKYTGTITKYFTILPAANQINNITFSNTSDIYTVNWNKTSIGTTKLKTGYQMLYSKDYAALSAAENAKSATSTNGVVSSYSTNNLNRLYAKLRSKAGEPMYVKVRSFVVINGIKYGQYSKIKGVVAPGSVTSTASYTIQKQGNTLLFTYSGNNTTEMIVMPYTVKRQSNQYNFTAACNVGHSEGSGVSYNIGEASNFNIPMSGNSYSIGTTYGSSSGTSVSYNNGSVSIFNIPMSGNSESISTTYSSNGTSAYGSVINAPIINTKTIVQMNLSLSSNMYTKLIKGQVITVQAESIKNVVARGKGDCYQFKADETISANKLTTKGYSMNVQLLTEGTIQS